MIRSFWIALIFISLPIFSQEKSINLADAVSKAVETSLELKELSFGQEEALSEELKLKGEMRPKLEVIAGVAPHYKITGDALSSVTDTEELSLATFSKVELIAPIYAFGRGDNYLKAIQGLQVKNKGDTELKKLEIAYKVKELYFGYLLALTVADFAETSIKEVEEALSKVDKQKNSEDFYRLNILMQQLLAKKAEIEKNLKLTLMGLNLYLTGSSKTTFVPSDEWIDRPEYALLTLDQYLQEARLNRPEFKMLSAGIKSKTEQLSGDQKGYLPMFAMMAKFDYVSSPLAEDQQSSFANDMYNKTALSLGVGLIWKFDLGVTAGKVSATRAQMNSLTTKLEYANLGIEMEVSQGYYDYQEKLQKVELLAKAHKESQKWLRKVSSGVALGLVNAKNIVDAYQTHATSLGQYFQALLESHLAYAKLIRSTGKIN